MRTYIEKLGKEYIEGRKESGKSPLRTGLYGERLRSMSWQGNRLFSYQTHVATIDRAGKVLYVTTKKYSQTTTRQMRDNEWLASCNGFHIVPTERVEDYAHILEG
jgi:hypothetical protein